ncbi:GntR family transcriptional regulator [Xylanimonas oleitrophica]|uniref:GntR family transcriptional regulator n=1 Tax=Xylanimonas oleitrophica TaxID=2607479 RepID=A0A2W5YE51_9MICO|nr:GntR family transcriptional regulator [Xylanimonas oleitrophica]
MEEAAARLRAMMRRAELAPGDRLGDERTLAAELGIPRARLREALAVLQAEGVVRRRLGRGGGVFASDGRIERNLNTIEGLPDITRVQGVHLTTTVLRAEIAVPSPADRRALGLAEGQMVYHVQRLRMADGTGLSLEDTRAPAALFPDLHRQDLTSFYRCLREVYGVEPKVSDESVEVTYADAEQARLLGVPPAAPLLRLVRRTLDGRGRAIEAGTELFVADRMRLHLRRYGVVGDPHHAPAAGGDRRVR